MWTFPDLHTCIESIEAHINSVGNYRGKVNWIVTCNDKNQTDEKEIDLLRKLQGISIPSDCNVKGDFCVLFNKDSKSKAENLNIAIFKILDEMRNHKLWKS